MVDQYDKFTQFAAMYLTNADGELTNQEVEYIQNSKYWDNWSEEYNTEFIQTAPVEQHIKLELNRLYYFNFKNRSKIEKMDFAVELFGLTICSEESGSSDGIDNVKSFNFLLAIFEMNFNEVVLEYKSRLS